MSGFSLIVIGEDGVSRPGWTIRAGDFIERTDCDVNRRLIEVHVRTSRPLPLSYRLRRWWEGLLRYGQ
jgi:hypothetical protein